MNQAKTFEEVAAATFPKPSAIHATGSAVVPYEQAKRYLSDKPLHRPARPRLHSTHAAPAIPYARLRELASKYQPPQEWYDE